MQHDLRISQQDWKTLRQLFQRSFRSKAAPETAAIGALGFCERSNRKEFLVAKLFLPSGSDLKIARQGNVVLSSTYIRRAHLYMRENGLTGLIIFHTHPLSDSYVAFSPFDDSEEPLLVRNLAD